MKNIESILKKYSKLEHNTDNYGIGGGLDGAKFASRRHEDAKNDPGKVTLGVAAQMFKKATGLELEQVKEVLEYAVPNMEWHHAGMLPKAYGGGMKKTYFLNAKEICLCAANWDNFVEKLSLSKVAEKTEAENKKAFETRKLEFLQAHAKKIVRTLSKPENFYVTDQEMNGKYGWFDSRYKSYNMPEYFTGWAFESFEKYKEFLDLK
jgi:hypothetical protein